jgi:hypothetical protein
VSGPGPHPEPHADLATREPLLLTTDAVWIRIYRLTNAPIYFGRSSDNRFDAPDSSYGVLYAATDSHGAFIETFGLSTGIRVVTATALAERGRARLEASRPLTLINLFDTGGLARIGADARLCSGDHSIAQRWCAALKSHPSRPDGIYYPARHDPPRAACALFDHVAPTITATPLGRLDDPAHAGLLADILETYRFALL